MLPGVPERATHDDKRSGTSSLYAALDFTTGKVIARAQSPSRARRAVACGVTCAAITPIRARNVATQAVIVATAATWRSAVRVSAVLLAIWG